VNPESWVPHGRSLMDYFNGDPSATIVVTSDLGEVEELNVAAWFRQPAESGPERAALDLCRGCVLDVGAGTGLHALELQARRLDVCAIDVVPEAVEIMRRRGVIDARQSEVHGFSGGPFDTVLIFANGAGLAETLAGLPGLLGTLERLVAPGGQILLDSTDLRPRDPEAAAAAGCVQDDDGLWRRPDGRYIGDLQFQLEYRGEKAPPFPQLYVDPDTLADVAGRCGWRCEVVERGRGRSYLARLTRREAEPVEGSGAGERRG
jgi:SAM-dependent methyltransferase